MILKRAAIGLVVIIAALYGLAFLNMRPEYSAAKKVYDAALSECAALPPSPGEPQTDEEFVQSFTRPQCPPERPRILDTAWFAAR